MITLSKIAKLAHVSVSTVSKAFAMSDEVNAETREAIFDIAKQHGCFKKYYRAKYPRLVVAVICPEFGSRYYADGIGTIQKALSVKSEYISTSDLRFEDGGYDAMEKLFERNAVPRALICGYDYLAIGAMKCIRDHNLSVPDDIAVVGKDEVYEAAFLNPPLSSLDTRINEACVIATDELMKVLNGSIESSRIAIGVLSEPASKSVFSASFGLSSSKGTKPYFVLRTKIYPKILDLEVKEF